MQPKSASVEHDQSLTTLLGSRGFLETMRRCVYSGLQHEADDIVADAVCEMVRWPPSTELKPTTVAMVAVRRRASRRRREVVTEVAAVATWTETAAAQPDEPYLEEDERAYVGQRLAAALATLPVGQAQAIAMSADELSQDEIARCLGVTRGTVASWIKRARAKLRPQLADLVAA